MVDRTQSRRWHLGVPGLLLLACFAAGTGNAVSNAAPAVDINVAGIAELMQVQGMTSAWAARIVRFRPYRSKLDLLDRGVVSPEEYRRIRDHIVAHRASHTQ